MNRPSCLSNEMRATLDWMSSFKMVSRNPLSWGTFENANTGGKQLDMSTTQFQSSYYDTPAAYAQLRTIKQTIDPIDLFHTPFTVK